ncbi:hypothetical protein H2200_010676 [Cladophialophora chaetospira]|uniref:WD40 repeat-like protein n=1 Tax=Cladophialophora chaetospira TaxID=386627 RepID=A0AA38X0J2_9EURO|nr:hypothetical protein H2200_010676 [Cladophialophora chaetospira]
MAKKLPTPTSPEGIQSSHQNIDLSMADSDSDANSEVLVESAEQRLTRLIDEHERDFKQKLRTLTSFAKILADDHAKSTKELKRAFKDYVTPKRDVRRPSQRSKVEMHPEDANGAVQPSAVPLEVLPSTFELSTSQPLRTNNPASLIRDVPRQSLQPAERADPADEREATPVDRRLRETMADMSAAALQIASNTQADSQDHQVPAPDTQSLQYRRKSALSQLIVDDDDGDTTDDIHHQESSDDDGETPSSDLPPAPNAPTATVTQTPKDKITIPEDTPKSGREAPKVRWSEEEEDRMIDILHTMTQQDVDEGTRTDMWKHVQAIHSTYGYNRTWQQMASKWSMQTRQKCEARGLKWAEKVMKKVPHVPRKRPAESLGMSTQKDGPLGFKVKRAKKSKKPVGADAVHGSLSRAPNQPLGPQSDVQLRYTFEGASSDIVQVEWSQDGKHFAAVSNSIINGDSNFSDNRPRNLLYGSLPTQTIRELPLHRTDREDLLPKYLYTTVSAVKFAKTGSRMYTGGYDHKLKVWDIQDENQVECKAELLYKHKRIEVMDVAGDRTPIVATGTNSGTRSIRIFLGDADLGEDCQTIRPLKESGLTSFAYAPTCLKFGKGQSQNRLIAGFGQDLDISEGTFGAGCIAMWQLAEATCEPMDFDRGKTFVSDCSWSPYGDFFVVGAVSSPTRKKDSLENSVVKLYSTKEREVITTFGCPAIDINDVTFDFGLVTASCTDGSTYVWDRRNPRSPLHVLNHGNPVQDFAPGRERELNDVGVRYVEWTTNAGQLYTGGSDGWLKLWDTRRSEADVLLQDVANIGSEIMCGKFSPDQSSLLIGDEDGRLHLFGRSKTALPKEDFTFMMAERWAGQ